MRLRFRTLLATFLAATAFVSAAHADQLADIKKKGEIVFGVLGTDEPNSFVDPKTREIVGYEVDIAKAIAAEDRRQAGLQAARRGRAHPRAAAGPRRRARRLAHAQQGARGADRLLADHLRHRPEGAGQDEQRHRRRAAAGRQEGADRQGRHAGAQHPQGGAHRRRRHVRDHAAGLPGAAAGQGRGLRQRRGLAGQRLRQAGPGQEGLRILPTNISTEPLALGIRKNEPALKAVVDGTLRELEKSGEADKIFVKWYGPATKLQFDKRTFKIDSDKI